MVIRWIIILLTLGLVSCSTPKIKTVTETVEVSKPILYCPAVDKNQLDRPQELPFTQITVETSDGEVAVLYKASVKILLDYTKRLELIIEQYGKFNKSYEELTKEINSEK